MTITTITDTPTTEADYAGYWLHVDILIWPKGWGDPEKVLKP